ncbi:uncharacterized protein [Triticum aestivum]|uniref:uncharacterized protein isoform X2 n=1 Tax=Triticum aestivum TaxID=4565 RepID=UPI001D01B48F|nr:uncharacterized protein LOC123103424 isoform X2 [Triticum aestivum]
MGRGWGIWRRTKLLLWLVPSQMVDVDHVVPWREGNIEEQLSHKDIDHPLSATAGPRWFMDPRSRCTDCSLKPMTDMQVHWSIILSITYGRQSNMDALKSTSFEDAHMVYMLMKEA